MRYLEPPLRTLFCIAFPFVSALALANNAPEPAAPKDKMHIDCILPDGEEATLSNTENAHSTIASVIDNETVSCALPEGETIFIIAVSKNFLWDRFTFLNENTAASGELRIAVSNSALPANSPKWKPVDGIVPFVHKRLFNLSLLGIETKYVRLSFHVDGSRAQTKTRATRAVVTQNMFEHSALAEAVDSKFTTNGSHSEEINFASLSVGPLAIVAKK
jgi:hypothetical protein